MITDHGDRGPDSDGDCSFTLLGFESWLIYDLHTHMYEQTSENQRNSYFFTIDDTAMMEGLVKDCKSPCFQSCCDYRRTHHT